MNHPQAVPKFRREGPRTLLKQRKVRLRDAEQSCRFNLSQVVLPPPSLEVRGHRATFIILCNITTGNHQSGKTVGSHRVVPSIHEGGVLDFGDMPSIRD
jgi:hypothetical protein